MRILAICVFLFLSATIGYSQQEAVTDIEFIEDTFHWGELEEGEVIQNVFTFTNTGEEPLIITNAKGSCGCTVPRYPTEPIMPGETADLLVQFNSKGKKGNQSKKITITANTDPAHTYLTIRGKILPKSLVKTTERKEIDPSTVQIFPNPTDEIAMISLKDYAGENLFIEIYDLHGKKYLSRDFGKQTGLDFTADFSGFTPGVYTVVMQIGNYNKLAKQVVVK